MKAAAIVAVLLVWWLADRAIAERDTCIAKLEAIASCKPEADGEIAAIYMNQGRVECAITGRNHGRRAVIDRRSM